MSKGSTKSTPQKRRAVPGEWEDTYLASLADGLSKEAASAEAGVHRTTPFKKAQGDEEFAEQEQIAYDTGTATIQREIRKRATLPEKASDTLLIFWAKNRAGMADRHEVSGPEGGPIATSAVPWDKLPDDVLRQIVDATRDSSE